MKVASKIKMWAVVAGITVLALALTTGGFSVGPDTGKSEQGKVVRAEVTLDVGSFEAQLTTNSNFSGQRDWVNPGQTYTVRYAQDVLVQRNERVQFWLTGATDIDRHVERRTMRCQLYVDGKPLNEPGKDSRTIRKGEPGEPVSCTALIIG